MTDTKANYNFCSQWNKTFFTCWIFETHTFKIHKKIHTGDDPFDCSTCAYSFSQSGVLTSHSRIHIERKPSPSPKCGIIFTLRVDFKRRMKDTHTIKANKYICNQCDNTFFTCRQNFETQTINIHKNIHT